jgi:hypothetical protein
MDNELLSDRELDSLLASVKPPALPAGFAARLQAKLDSSPTAQIIAFPKASAAPKSRMWLSAIPLAASLALGLYWGAVGTVPDALSSIGNTVLASSDDASWSIGIEDTESFLNGDLS